MVEQLFCPDCGDERDIEIREEMETYPVKGEPIEVLACVTYCRHCGNQIWNNKLDDENLKNAYRHYRRIHGLLQPEEIKRIRVKYGLSQTTFGKILGFGDKTIARYESGSIQDEAYNKLIALADCPDIFEELLAMSNNALKESELDRARHALTRFDHKIGLQISKKSEKGRYVRARTRI